MNAPALPGRGPRTETILGLFVVVVALVVAVGFLFDLPYGFGGWELALMATPIVLATVALGVLLRISGRRRPPGPPASAAPEADERLSRPGTRRSRR
jgi:hypothetical protein